jgi:hypothetical protein
MTEVAPGSPEEWVAPEEREVAENIPHLCNGDGFKLQKLVLDSENVVGLRSGKTDAALSCRGIVSGEKFRMIYGNGMNCPTVSKIEKVKYAGDDQEYYWIYFSETSAYQYDPRDRVASRQSAKQAESSESKNGEGWTRKALRKVLEWMGN